MATFGNIIPFARKSTLPKAGLLKQLWESIKGGWNPAYSPQLQQPTNLLERLIRGGGSALGAIPQYTAGAMAGQAAVPIPILGAALGFGGTGALRETYRQARTGPKGIEDPKNILKQAALDAALSPILRVTGKLPIGLRVPATGATMAGLAGASGAKGEDVTASGILGALMGIPGNRMNNLKLPKAAKPGEVITKGERTSGLTQEQTLDIPTYLRNQPKKFTGTTTPKPAGYYGQTTSPQNMATDLLNTLKKGQKPQVEGVGETLYHGTSVENANQIVNEGFNLSSEGLKGGSGNKNFGISFSKKPNIAELHATMGGRKPRGGTVVPFTLDKNAKIFKATDVPQEYIKNGHTTAMQVETYAKLHGFDGIDLANLEESGIIKGGRAGVKESEVLIFNPKVIKPASKSVEGVIEGKNLSVSPEGNVGTVTDYRNLSPDQKMALEYMKKFPQKYTPKEELLPWETEGTKPPVETPPTPDIPIPKETPPKNFVRGWMDALRERTMRISPQFPFKESEVVETLGKEPGKMLVAQGRKLHYLREFVFKKRNADIYKSLGLEGMTPDEIKNVHLASERKAAPLNEKVANAVAIIDKIKMEEAKKFGFDENIEYMHRALNELGKAEMWKNKSSLVKELATKLKMSEYDVQEMLKHGTPRGGFEYRRILDAIPEEYRDFSTEPIKTWFNDLAAADARLATFGQNSQMADKLINQMSSLGKTPHEQQFLFELGRSYKERMLGKNWAYSESSKLVNLLRNSMMFKLSPITTLTNESQGLVASYLRYGTKGITDMMKSGGDKLVRELGFQDVRGKIGEQIPAKSWGFKYMKAIGFPQSEVRQAARVMKATEGAMNRAWETLKANPTDTKALSALKQMGMFVDDKVLAQALKTGEIPAIERAVGLIDTTRQLIFTPTPGEKPLLYTNLGQMGNLAYIFHHYLLEQTKLLASAPLHRQLAYLGILVPMFGIPMVTLRRVIQGKELPEDIWDWYKQSSVSGPGGPLELVTPLGTERGALQYMLGGMYPAYNIPKSIVDDLQRKEPSAKSTTSALWYGFTPPSGTLYGPRVLEKLFPKKKTGSKGKRRMTIIK